MPHDIPDFVRAAEQYEKRRAEKVSLFFKLIKDPDIQPYLALLRDDGHPTNGKKKKQFVPPVGFKTGNGIRDAIRALDLSQKVAANWVLEQLRKKQFKFAARDELGAVSDALYAMVRSGEISRFDPEKAGGQILY